jgi:hypothetical protein
MSAEPGTNADETTAERVASVSLHKTNEQKRAAAKLIMHRAFEHAEQTTPFSSDAFVAAVEASVEVVAPDVEKMTPEKVEKELKERWVALGRTD